MQYFTEQDIRLGCLSGDRQAQEAFVRQFSGLIYQTVQYTLKAKNVPYAHSDLEDLHNAIFLQFFEKKCRKLRQYQGKNGCSLASWIRIVAVRIVLNHIRQKGIDAIGWQKKRVPLEELSELEGGEEIPTAALERAEQERLVQNGIQTLPPRDRLFMRLHFGQGLAMEDVAYAMKISVQNAYTVKHRAIQRLKSYVFSARK